MLYICFSTLCLQVSSADYFCKQFGTQIRLDKISKLFYPNGMHIFFSKRLILKRISRRQKHAKTQLAKSLTCSLGIYLIYVAENKGLLNVQLRFIKSFSNFHFVVKYVLKGCPLEAKTAPEK